MAEAQLSDLQEVFVPFEAEKVDGCNIIYFNEALASEKTANDILNTYSYIVRIQPISPRPLAPIKTFMAERYGGDGILGNGGGARCGFDGVWQLKGLGPNQLVGKDVDAGHSDGNLSLHTAIYESIWAEIINIALPFGAIRTVAILDTGRKFEERGTLTSRGLLVRQPAVRPAHFMRATYFEEKQKDSLSEDALRVKAAIIKLKKFLPGANCASPPDNSTKQLESGLLELASRFAEQFAAARAKHIIHYNVSASNLSIDGAWLDLSGTRLFTHLIAVDPVDIERSNSEHFPAIDCLSSLCYYLEKYSVITHQEHEHLLAEANKQFLHIYYRKLSLYQAAQAGFPLWILRLLEGSPELEIFSKNIQKISTLQNFVVNTVHTNGGWSGYESWNARLFNDLLLSSGGCSTADLAWLNTSPLAKAQLLTSHKELFNRASTIAKKYHIEPKNLYRCILINTTRSNRSNSILHNLNSRINHITNDTTTNKKIACLEIFDEALLAAKMSLGNEWSKYTLVWLSNALSIWFDPTTGMYKLNAIDSTPMRFDTLIKLNEHQKEINRALDFYSKIRSYLSN